MNIATAIPMMAPLIERANSGGRAESRKGWLANATATHEATKRRSDEATKRRCRDEVLQLDS